MFATLRRSVYRYPVRLAVQASASALVTFALCWSLGLPDRSWAIISALLVTGASVGNSLRAGFARFAGAIVGLLVGLACLFTIGTGMPQTAVSLAVAVAAMSFMVGLKPELRYGFVTLAILILAPGGDAIETAWSKAAAVTLGSIVGAVVAAVVLPLHAHRTSRKHLARAVLHCAALLETSIGRLLGQSDAELAPIHQKIRSEMAAAREMAQQSQFRLFHPKRKYVLPEEVLTRVERLWHTLVLFDRMDGEPLPERPREILHAALVEAVRSARDYLRELADAVEEGRVPRSPSTLRRRVADVDRAFQTVRRRQATAQLTDDAAERVFAISFGFKQIGKNAEETAMLLGADIEGPN